MPRRHTVEAELVFQLARKRFEESLNHQNGDDAINDSPPPSAV